VATAEIVTIGTELLLGQLVDTNTAIIARALADVGIDVHRQTSVGDNERRIAAAVSEAHARADAVICAGGLGPTVDDMTREAVAQATGRELVLHEPSLAAIRARVERLGRVMSENNARQAMLPRGATAIENPNGTAPGFIVEVGRKAVIAVPGVPAEMRWMLRERVIPFLTDRFGVSATIVTRVLHTFGASESDIDLRIADLFRSGVNPSIAVLAHSGQIDVKLTAKAGSREQAVAMIRELEPIVRERLGDPVFGADDDTLEGVAGARLRERGWTLAVAESCTGGMLAETITRAPGSSDYFVGGVIAYSDDVKVERLRVSADLLARHGAVSEEVSIAMAQGVKAELKSDVGISITGIAGPGGGTKEKPVGLVYIGLAVPGRSAEAMKRRLPGDREFIRRLATMHALSLLIRSL